MKKFGLAFVALLLVFVIYYMTVGSKQIKKEIRSEVNKNLVELKQYGFGVKEQNLSTNKQHIVLTIEDSSKVSGYLNKQSSAKVLTSDIELIKGMQIAVDIEYMPSAKDAISMDIYPVKLPTLFYQDITTDKEKALLKELEKMLDEKVFLAHVNINKLLNSFDGYFKDIDREIKIPDSNESIHLLSKGAKFKGTLDGDKVDDATQTVDILSITLGNDFKMSLSGFIYDIENIEDLSNQKIKYSIKSFNFLKKPELLIDVKNISGSSKKELNGKLLNTAGSLNIDSITLREDKSEIKFDKINMESRAKNINKEVFEKLQELSAKEETSPTESMNELVELLKVLIKDNVIVEVPNISAQKITTGGKTFDGFKISAKFSADKNVTLQNINSIDGMLEVLDAKIEIEASNELVAYIAKNPQMVIMMMVIQPIEKNGKKYFNIEFNKSSLKVNGRPLL